jgi:hypothetical protein
VSFTGFSIATAIEIAEEIAELSPIATRGTKHLMDRELSLNTSCKVQMNPEAHRLSPHVPRCARTLVRFASSFSIPIGIADSCFNSLISLFDSVEEGLAYTALWNSAMLQAKDLQLAMSAFGDRKSAGVSSQRPPDFPDLFEKEGGGRQSKL